MKKLIFILIFSSFAMISFGEKPFVMKFIPLYGHQQIIPGEENYLLSDTDSIRFDVLKFYVSSVRLLLDDQVVYSEVNSFHLIDCSVKENREIKFNHPENIKFNRVRFYLGIDSTTNMSGALGGDLDPTKGMYWTWQSGYINFKVEGYSPKCTSRNHEFQFHLGGYAYPENALRQIEIRTNGKDKAEIEIDMKKFIEKLNLPELEHIMSPGKKAMELSTLASECFKLKQQ